MLKHRLLAGVSLCLILVMGAINANAATSYSTDVKTARMVSVCAQIDSGGAAGTMEIGTNNGSGAFGTTLAIFTLNYNSACSVSGAIATFNGFPKSDLTADATGTAAFARICSSAGCSSGLKVSGLTVCTSGCDINLVNTSIVINQPVTLSSYSITHAP